MERHPLDLVSLTAGAVFSVAALIGLTDAISLTAQDLRWIGPALLVLFGIVLVTTSVTRRDGERPERQRTDSAASTPTGPPNP